jgi:carboxylesterase type B
VLLFGQSAGATNAFIVITLPEARSLISAAVSGSGGGRDVATNTFAQALGASYARSLICSINDVRN